MKKKQIESELCRKYLKSKELFKWFIEKHFGLKKYLELWELAEQDKDQELRAELESIWDELPDTVFNLEVNPPGWEAFLHLIEE